MADSSTAARTSRASKTRCPFHPTRISVATAWAVLPLAILAASATDVRPGPPRRPSAAPAMASVHGAADGQLIIHRKVADHPVRLADGDRVHDADLVQVGYTAAKDVHGVILSIDGAGTVTLHSPERGDASTALEHGHFAVLPHAYELDAAPGFERFFLVTSRAPIDVAVVLDAAHRLASRPEAARHRELDLPHPWQQSSVLLRKLESSLP